MAGKNSYTKAVAALTAAFVLAAGGYRLGRSPAQGPYQVSVQRTDPLPARSSPVEEEPERPDSLLPGERIDINTAGAGDLERLPGIGEKRAQDIIAHREEHGPFQSVEELDDVPGIGPGILAGLRDYAQAGPG